MDDQRQSALYVDFENIYYFIKNRVDQTSDAVEISVNAIRNLRKWLADERKTTCVVQHAYADFDSIGGSAQGSFYLIGVEPHFVLGTEHKNAADMRMCVDVMATFYTRQEIGVFVLVAGDRDYIPVIQHLKQHGRDILVVSFKGSVSGDLLQVVGEDNFIDLQDMLPDDVELKEERVPQTTVRTAIPLERIPVREAPTAYQPPAPKFEPVSPIDEGPETDALVIMFMEFPGKAEIWVTPYLRRLREQMTNLADYERKALISTLQQKGAITVEKRPGEENDYSVIIPNWNHPDVQKLNPG